ncbi:hypothetical protein SEA_KEALII_11 [Arthrobacter phage KeAlii]|uniref:Uncharacterized protein n=1 Tax=Arthrobacter phage KeAlii TaxID=2885973 RepID=A0AA94WSX1_9CAUD|nr:hypothetical protein PQE15_gp11 [Arthrobacter phage KeAlii]UDL14617.1 hypothetical protein SEA_KEALII_11 [Arthrobacter phage KeAlii]
MANKIRLDRAGMAQMLNSAKVTQEVIDLGRSVGTAVQLPAINGPQAATTVTKARIASGGRLSARTGINVTIAHPAGMRVEAKYGPLRKAAASRGLSVKGRAK